MRSWCSTNDLKLTLLPVSGPPLCSLKPLFSKVPVLKPMDLMVEVSPRRVFANAHTYHVNSISVNSDYETYMSADDLRINLWHLDITDRSFSILFGVKVLRGASGPAHVLSCGLIKAAVELSKHEDADKIMHTLKYRCFHMLRNQSLPTHTHAHCKIPLCCIKSCVKATGWGEGNIILEE